MKLRDVWPLVRETGKQFIDDKGPRLGAALAFYTALSLSPLLLVVISIAGAVFGEQAARGEIAAQIQDMTGEEGAKAVQSMLASAQSGKKSTLMTIVGVATLVFAASGVFAQLQEALDTVWDLRKDQLPSGILAMVMDRLLSFSAVCGMAFLLLVSLVFGAAVSALNGWAERQLGYSGWGLQLVNQALSFLMTTAMFAFIFKVLPHARPSYRDVFLGAGITAALFTLGKYLIGLYMAQAAPGSAYGAAGSFIVLLLWIYYSTQILLFGAEFTQVYANTHGSGLNRDLRGEGDKAAEKTQPPEGV